MARKAGADLLAAKERRKKKLAIVGAVLLVAVLAIQVPRTMKMLNRPSGPPAEEAQAADEETRPPAPTSAAAPLPQAAPPLVEGGSLGSARLVAFTRFSRKDPFRPQIREDAGAGASERSAARPAAKPKTTKERKSAHAGASERKERPKLVPRRGGGVRSRPALATSALISINGVREEVKIGGAFPASDKLFTLASLGPGVAKIGISGGSLAGGGRTVTLERGRDLTLENTASGARYRLRLLSIS